MDEVAKVNLEKPLLLRDPSSLLISVNFDPKLVALLREVKYLEQREGMDHVIPESAGKVFEQNETYIKFLQVREEIILCIHIYIHVYTCMYIHVLKLIVTCLCS